MFLETGIDKMVSYAPMQTLLYQGGSMHGAEANHFESLSEVKGILSVTFME